MSRFYSFAKGLLGPVLRLVFRFDVHGSAKLPDNAAIVVCNHISNWDVLALSCVMDRQIRYMAKRELFKNPIVRRVIEGLGAFPIDRGSADVAAIRKSLEILSDGGVVGIFPQGTRVKDDSSFEVAGGVAMIALRSHAEIVPVHIRGPYKPFSRVRIDIGEAYTPAPEGTRVSRELITGVSEGVAARVNELKARSMSAREE